MPLKISMLSEKQKFTKTKCSQLVSYNCFRNYFVVGAVFVSIVVLVSVLRRNEASATLELSGFARFHESPPAVAEIVREVAPPAPQLEVKELQDEAEKEGFENERRNEEIVVMCDRSEEEWFQSLMMSDINPIYEEVVKYLRCHRIHPPNPQLDPLPHAEHLEPPKISFHVQKALKGLKNGFFVDVGGDSGLGRKFKYSRTSWLETKYNWTGLIIEGHPKYRTELLEVHRNAWYSDTCISESRDLGQREFVDPADISADFGKEYLNVSEPNCFVFQSFGLVPCFPLASLLAALDVQHVDFLSLDVGQQFDVANALEALDLDSGLQIDLIQVQTGRSKNVQFEVGNWAISQGYSSVYKGRDGDFIFQKK